MARPLSARQRVFVAEYLKEFNATAAAVAAGYSERSAASIGHENLRKPEIAAEVERRLAELTMSTEEALLRLTEQGRGAHTAFIDDVGQVDLAGLKAAGLGHLIKSTKVTQWGLVVEFYDGQAAIDKILRVRGAYVERRELTGADGGPIQTRDGLDEVSDDELQRRIGTLARGALALLGGGAVAVDAARAAADDPASEE